MIQILENKLLIPQLYQNYLCLFYKNNHKDYSNFSFCMIIHPLLCQP